MGIIIDPLINISVLEKNYKLRNNITFCWSAFHVQAIYSPGFIVLGWLRVCGLSKSTGG